MTLGQVRRGAEGELRAVGGEGGASGGGGVEEAGRVGGEMVKGTNESKNKSFSPWDPFLSRVVFTVP